MSRLTNTRRRDLDRVIGCAVAVAPFSMAFVSLVPSLLPTSRELNIIHYLQTSVYKTIEYLIVDCRSRRMLEFTVSLNVHGIYS